jgi:hypothetical protein
MWKEKHLAMVEKENSSRNRTSGDAGLEGEKVSDLVDTVGVLDTGVSRSTCSWASSTAQLRSRGERTTEAIEEDPHEEAPHEENDDQNC